MFLSRRFVVRRRGPPSFQSLAACPTLRELQESYNSARNNPTPIFLVLWEGRLPHLFIGYVRILVEAAHGYCYVQLMPVSMSHAPDMSFALTLRYNAVTMRAACSFGPALADRLFSRAACTT